MKTGALPQPDPRVQTEFLLCSDGAIYVNIGDIPPERYAGRVVLVGYALSRKESKQRGREGLFKLAMSAPLGLGSDGRIYVPESEIGEADKARRRAFRGFRANAEEKARILVELHRMALNLSYVCGIANT